jgi:hypothetical protein
MPEETSNQKFKKACPKIEKESGKKQGGKRLKGAKRYMVGKVGKIEISRISTPFLNF